MLDESLQSSLKHYNKAMSGVREKLQASKLSPMLALQTCLLFMCIEIMQDNLQNVVGLLNQAERIMRSSTAELTKDEKSLYKALNRIVIQSTASAAWFGWNQRPVITPINPVFDAVTEYTTMAEAKDGLFEFINEAQHTLCEINGILPGEFSEVTESAGNGHKKGFVQCLFDQEFEANRSNSNMRQPSLSRRTFEEQQRLHASLRQWYTAFKNTSPSQEDHVLCLEIHYRVAIIWISTWNCDQQDDFDQFTELFQQIVDLAERYVRRVQIDKSVYTLGTAVLGPLSATAWKCRVPLIRRKAARLMWEIPSTRECVWYVVRQQSLACLLLFLKTSFQVFQNLRRDRRATHHHRRRRRAVVDLQKLQSLGHFLSDRQFFPSFRVQTSCFLLGNLQLHGRALGTSRHAESALRQRRARTCLPGL
jgi:hypothetical protein